ncbi:ABC transporter ATP-binding protein [Salinispora tropica]|uniref:ABC-type quaternary amine transporter n=1 Tax=Salinispora tropica (strain ATCC BAA-916 / DSM 44818 / JCM 13857 / NBRC 105044 / CNB-440) TaxID=369723 RepID=A4XCR2_SALTO|nr:ATP-binding cassette domain-containing protein [Salinispora tropica]ABP56719.1 glycine betaine/L-proline ABC transporter, ATPase subunit [Salinispora tropica CNB-440]
MDATPRGSADDEARAASISLDSIGKRYPDGTEAVRELTLEVAAGELVVLIGPSGCGKSTVLRMVNRLIEPTAGRILLDGADVTRVDPVRLRRRIGYVIQNVGLFPHQTISANVATVPQLLGWPRDRRRQRVTELLELVGLDPAQFGARYPHELSGGQRQRVGVARALAADPVVLLMDEPFSAVDPIVRTRLQEEFLRLQAEVRKTIVLVTHDLDEAVRLGDRIAVLSEGGRLEQYDTPAAVLGAPATPFVREFVGADRGIRRLAVTPVTRETVEPVSATPTAADLPTVPLGASAYDALGVLLTSTADRVMVTDQEQPVGVLTRSRLLALGHSDDQSRPPTPNRVFTPADSR